MMNRKGAGGADWVIYVAIAVGLVFVTIWITGNPFSGSSLGVSFSQGLASSHSFTEYWGERAGFLDYIFGGIPGGIDSLVSPKTIPFLVIGVWLLIFLTFGDILSVFGFYTKPIAWLIALILAVLVANLKIVTMLLLGSLVLTSALGAFSVIASIVGIFAIFIAFHFGTAAFRERIILRRAQDVAIRAVAGGKIAASGATVLADVAKAAEEAAKRK